MKFSTTDTITCMEGLRGSPELKPVGMFYTCVDGEEAISGRNKVPYPFKTVDLSIDVDIGFSGIGNGNVSVTPERITMEPDENAILKCTVKNMQVNKVKVKGLDCSMESIKLIDPDLL